MKYWRAGLWRNNSLKVVIYRLLAKKIEGLSTPENQTMSEIAVKDFLNYYKTTRNLLGIPGSTENAKYMLEDELEEHPVEIIKEIEDWLDNWLIKWRQRVKLTLSPIKEEKDIQKMEMQIAPVMSRLTFIEELRDIVIGSLVKSGEICFTDLLADNIIKAALMSVAQYYTDKNKMIQVLEKNPHIILEAVLKKVKSIKNFKGPLVTIRIEKRLFRDSLMPEGFF
ncbi:MAG: hypothetical protein DRJ46_02005 [Thermoprotei archaeon]|nr:MAG: hypothetical protein DRJ46_02005 [Thermoprotei archaeon]